MARIKPEDQLFKTKDNGFYIDARLTALINGSRYDFMGKTIFTSSFFRESIGFGITNIDIEVNTSLQPIITITFKDLYGNAVFGKTAKKGLSSGEYGVGDFSALFNWPPPKFLFTFKGFLGRQVSWLLNLKQTSTTYQSDGSYDIKCEFVPNQWGFMADLPFLFLYAVKGLKKRELSTGDFQKERTIFDLIKIGKSVEVKTKGVTKEFDTLLQQMTLIKSGRIVEAVAYSSVVKLDETITGEAGKLQVVSSGSGKNRKEFKPITIKTPTAENINTIEKIKEYTSGSPESLNKVNKYLLLNSEIGDSKPLGISLGDDSDYRENISTRTKIIDENIKVIEDAIKKRSFEATKSQLRQITIGEIFQQLAKDSGYIIGKILEAGLKGYSEQPERATNNKLIGWQYPLILDDTSQEIPYEEAKVELQFVDDFISAVSEGIAANSSQNAQASSVGNENALIKRINNLEALRDNPYSAFYRNITENILVRSGIISYLTRSNDPNYPGDFGNSALNPFDRDSVEEITQLATADMENITLEMLTSLSDEDFLKLKRFCLFWVRFISADGESYLNDKGEEDGEVGTASEALAREVVVDRGANPPTKVSLRQIINSVFTQRGDSLEINTSNSNESEEKFDSSNASLIDLDTLQARTLFNNGILYEIPKDYISENVWVYVVFEGQDATKAKEVNSANTDAELKGTQEEDIDEEPVGFVAINTYQNTDGVLGRVEYLNDVLSGVGGGGYGKPALKYSVISNATARMFKDPEYYQNQVLYPTDTKIVPVVKNPNELAARNLVYTVAYHHDKTSDGLIFGLFEDRTSSINQRACVVAMCQNVLDRMNQLEEEKNKIVSTVLGNATEHKTSLYKQFHVLYHQWESLIYKDPKNDECKSEGETPLNEKTVTKELEERYGGKKKHVTTKGGSKKGEDNPGTLSSQINSVESNSFIYDYPLNTKAGINVKNSIINIDPLYSPDGNTTVLNIIQQICTKNHFTFVPIPGNGNFNDYKEIFKPQISTQVELKNLFYIMFSPTPESRVKINNSSKEFLQPTEKDWEIDQDIFEVRVGDPLNKIFKGVSVDTYENKATAESIVNLQRLTDNQNQNKKVTTDCSMLPVMEGRSYKANFDMLGAAQVFPMQYFYLDSIPLFNGVYQVMKVSHSITPNDMTTKAEGIKMRFSKRELGGIQPITLELLEKLEVGEIIPENAIIAAELDQLVTEDDNYKLVSDLEDGNGTQNYEDVGTSSVIIPPVLAKVQNSKQLARAKNASGSVPLGSFTTPSGKVISKAERVKNMNEFIQDVLGPFAEFLKTNYFNLYQNLYITSTTRDYVPKGGSSTSQHFYAQAVDMQIAASGFKTVNDKNLELLHAIIRFYAQTSVGYDQILFETRNKKSCWIHWSYKRNGNRNQILRFVEDKTYKSSKLNTTGKKIAFLPKAGDLPLYV